MERTKTTLMILECVDHTSGGTALQKEIRYYLNKELDGCLVDKNDLHKVIDTVNERIEQLCIEHPSWKREEFADTGRSYYTDDTWIRLGSSGVVLRAKPAKGIFC